MKSKFGTIRKLHSVEHLSYFPGKPIFSVHIHPDESRVATGGQGSIVVAIVHANRVCYGLNGSIECNG